jgi:ribose-phosphate pyrophosphokinase
MQPAVKELGLDPIYIQGWSHDNGDCSQVYFSIPIGLYPDNMPIINHDDIDKHIMYNILVRPRTLTEFVAAMMLKYSFDERDFNKTGVVLILPFIPGARQDRLNSSGDYLFTAKFIAKIINGGIFERVVVVDPHSEVAPALIDNCRVVNLIKGNSCSASLILGTLKKENYAAVVAPDAGAEKRAKEWSNALGIPVIHAWKTRDISNGKLTGFGHEPIPVDVQGKKMLVVDDICDGGGTFVGLGEVLKKSNIQVDLFVTHGVFSKGVRHLTQIFDKVYTTDTIPQTDDIRKEPGVVVFDICKFLFDY